MTVLLSDVFEKVSSLSPDLQDEIARSWSIELNEEIKWYNSLQNSQDKLESMANIALSEFHQGKTLPKGFGEI